jgi:hypothetical protein
VTRQLRLSALASHFTERVPLSDFGDDERKRLRAQSEETVWEAQVGSECRVMLKRSGLRSARLPGNDLRQHTGFPAVPGVCVLRLSSASGALRELEAGGPKTRNCCERPQGADQEVIQRSCGKSFSEAEAGVIWQNQEGAGRRRRCTKR